MEGKQPCSVTIMKYLDRDGQYRFIVKDRYSFPDMLDRLDYLRDLKDEMIESGEMTRHLWTEEAVLFL